MKIILQGLGGFALVDRGIIIECQSCTASIGAVDFIPSGIHL
ncbi:Uncharacterised protein [Vibrio cholerae]|nr:Uncharacterised protein [Vibrio cholerae]